MTAPPPLTKRKDGLLSLRQSGHWRAPDGKHRFIFCMIAYPSHELDRLISEYGTRIVHAVDREGTPIFWNAVEQDRLDCASMLLDYAKSNAIPVPFTCTGGRYDDVLSRTIANRSDARIEFALDKLTGKYATVAETVQLLAENLPGILFVYPKITQKFLNEDRFAIEYARFEAPKDLFGEKGETPIVMFTKNYPESWQTMDSHAARRFWFENGECCEKLWSGGQEIEVVAKFQCVHPWQLLNRRMMYVRSRIRLN